MKPNTVSVVGGGASLARLGADGRARIPGLRIGVNDSFVRMACDVGVSMDRLWLENRWAELLEIRKPVWARRSALRNLPDRHGWLHPFECDHQTRELSDAPGRLNGAHSGACALNLAYQMRPHRIILWGFDLSRGPAGERHWYPPYPWAKTPDSGTPDSIYRQWVGRMKFAAVACAAAGIQLCYASTEAPEGFPASIERMDPCRLLL